MPRCTVQPPWKPSLAPVIRTVPGVKNGSGSPASTTRPAPSTLPSTAPPRWTIKMPLLPSRTRPPVSTCSSARPSVRSDRSSSAPWATWRTNAPAPSALSLPICSRPCRTRTTLSALPLAPFSSRRPAPVLVSPLPFIGWLNTTSNPWLSTLMALKLVLRPAAMDRSAPARSVPPTMLSTPPAAPSRASRSSTSLALSSATPPAWLLLPVKVKVPPSRLSRPAPLMSPLIWCACAGAALMLAAALSTSIGRARA